jgi:dolichol-phosphate mannosyltransferase
LKITVVIPTYNERDNIQLLTDSILSQDPRINILVVDDNSPDGTGVLVDAMAEVEPRIRIMHRQGKLGLGSAYRAGFRRALDDGADLIVEMDADFSHDPAMLPRFIEQMTRFDMVVGSRYLHGVSVVNWPIRRLILSYCASVYTRTITGLKLSDCTGGFKCFRREVLEAIDLESIRSDGYSFQIEVNYRCHELGYAIGEIPIIFVDRHAGSSKMSKQIVREAVFMVWKLKLGSMVKSLFRTEKRRA